MQKSTTFLLVFADPVSPNFSQPIDREAAFRCSHCQKLIAVTLRAAGNYNLGPNSMHGHASPPNGDIRAFPHIKLVKIVPEVKADEAPEFCPRPVANAFLDGRANLSEHRWTAAASCFRISIDRASKLLWADNNLGEMPHNLGKRIRQLGDRMDVPQALLDWLDVVKAVGNDQHEVEDVAREDAEDASHFAEVFLTYAYTLPTRLREFRKRRDAEPEGAAS
jgi:hypothetical protein